MRFVAISLCFLMAANAPSILCRTTPQQVRSERRFILLLLGQSARESAQEWRKIAPLVTTRTDVEAILGPASDGFEVLYQLKDGKLSIEYSTGPCSSGQKGGWNLPQNVVVSLHFVPLHAMKVSKLDLKKFRRVVDDHLPSVTYYINDDEGITYAIQQGKVDYVEYGPAKKYEYLYCKD
jgi:hypothetical protein